MHQWKVDIIRAFLERGHPWAGLIALLLVMVPSIITALILLS